METFNYEAPSTIDQAITLMSENNGQVLILAGGTDLLDGSSLSTNVVLDLTPMDDNPSAAFLNGASAGTTSLTMLSYPTAPGDTLQPAAYFSRKVIY